MEYVTEQLLELSFAAYRVNKGYEKQTRRYSEGQPTTYSNKELITYSAAYYNQAEEENKVLKTWIPTDFIALQVTDEDKKAKIDADKHMRRYTFLALGNISDFDKDMFAVYSSEKTPVNKIGLIAYLPAFINRELVEKQYKLRLKNEYSQSSFYDKSVEGVIEILKKVWIENAQKFVYIAGIDGNLVSFWTDKKYNLESKYNITAKVKKHDKERETDLPMSCLNYVKLKEV
jgi:hypothetical protein